MVIADEVRADVEAKRKANEEAQALARQEMLVDLRRDFTDAARDALTTLKDVMANAQSDFVREKAAVDILNFVERNFEGEFKRKAEDDQPQISAPTVNVLMPIMAMPPPGQIQAVSSFTVSRPDGSTKAIGEAPGGGRVQPNQFIREVDVPVVAREDHRDEQPLDAGDVAHFPDPGREKSGRFAIWPRFQ